MIGLLRGEIIFIGEGELLIDVSGVGYRVQAGARMSAAFNQGDSAELYIETRMSESAIALFGFITEIERLWFVRLQAVPGVGARVALGVLDVLSPTELSDAIALGDAPAIQRTKGVGRKLAERIVAEFANAPGLPGYEPTRLAQGAASDGVGAIREGVISALVNLGYGRSEAARAVASIADQGETADNRDEAQWIREALKALSI